MTLATEATGASSTGSIATAGGEELADFDAILAVVDAVARRSFAVDAVARRSFAVDAVARRSVGEVTIEINDES